MAVATFRRNQELVSLLDSLESQKTDHPFKVMVVDNSPDQEARGVSLAHRLNVLYVSETRPGIVEARNRALDELYTGHYKAIAFIDDDETARSDWLDHLESARLLWDADAVSGPVVTELPDTAPTWMRQGGFHQRKRHQTGHEVPFAATNNVLISADSLRRLGSPTFSHDFNLTGGEDSDFFYRMGKSGARIIWCDEAVVEEVVPATRLSVSWIWKRLYWNGNVAARIESRDKTVLNVALSGVGRIAYGMVRCLVSLIRGRGLQFEDAKFVPQGFGRLSFVFGSSIEAYARGDG